MGDRRGLAIAIVAHFRFCHQLIDLFALTPQWLNRKGNSHFGDR